MVKAKPSRINNTAYRFAFAIRFDLHIPVPKPLGDKCPYGNCGRAIDSRLLHAFLCIHNKGALITRHHAVVRAIYTFIKRLERHLEGGTVHREPFMTSCNYNILDAADTTAYRPDIAVYRDDHFDILDVQISHPTNDAAHTRDVDRMVTKVEKDKMRHYTSKFNVPPARVIPIALDSYGRLGPIATDYFDTICGIIATKQVGGDIDAISLKLAQLRSALYETISCTLANGNSRVISSYLSLGQRKPHLLQAAPQLDPPAG